MSEASALYTGTVVHQRLRPLRHRLRYRMFSLLLDLDELPQLGESLRLFSVNRFNLFSLHERDYGCGDGTPLRQQIDRQLLDASLRAGGSIRLLTMPRILGYAFNPLSVYFCSLPDGTLQAILYEVNNTFGERHSYLVEVAESQRGGRAIKQHCPKELHVSPFLRMDLDYAFHIEPPSADRAELAIGITARDTQGPVLTALLKSRRRRLSDASLALVFLTHPLMTLKVIAAIHWEALRLWTKGARLQPRPPAPNRPVTFITSEEP